MDRKQLFDKIEIVIRHLLSEQNRDRYSSAYGCFDRRHWGWKLVDYPEATFQRNVYPLAWYLRKIKEENTAKKEILTESVIAGLLYSVKIQNKDGSFNQAFPNEHSFGATSFLLHPLLEAYRLVKSEMDSKSCAAVDKCLNKGAQFLCNNNESHGFISNHIAGAVLSLLSCASYYNVEKYFNRAIYLLELLLENQSPEGWFPEYEGPDPGYQSLCIYYLAQIYKFEGFGSVYKNYSAFKKAMKNAISFLSWFIHPDGTYAGEYGSRRTAIYYPGGIALLQNDFTLSIAMTKFMFTSIIQGTTVSIEDIDIGNTAPLLSNYTMLYDFFDQNIKNSTVSEKKIQLPSQTDKVNKDFPEAGLFIRGNNNYYAVVGVINGGVVKIFDKRSKKIIWDDGGYVGETKDGTLFTTQITDLSKRCKFDSEILTLKTPFYEMKNDLPEPCRFIFLRFLNLTLMRNIHLGNIIKLFLVRMLINRKRKFPLTLERSIKFHNDKISIRDKLEINKNVKIKWLEYGIPFTSIHMASSRYFQLYSEKIKKTPIKVDVKALEREHVINLEVIL